MEVATPVNGAIMGIEHPGFRDDPSVAVVEILEKLFRVVPSARNDYGID